MDNLLLAGALAAIALAERLPGLRFERSRFLRRYFCTDLFYLLSSGVGLALVLREAGLRAAAAFGTLAPGFAALPPALEIALAVVLYDVGAYASHLALHRVETLWRFHKVHHSSQILDWLATFRGHALEHALRHLASAVLLLLVGFSLSAVAAAAAIYTAWAAFGHSNLGIDLRWAEPVLITPRLHRLHHAAGTSERNLGTIFSLWDRLRGNLVTDPNAPLTPLGVPGELETYPQSWLPQLVEPLLSWPRPSGADAWRANLEAAPRMSRTSDSCDLRSST